MAVPTFRSAVFALTLGSGLALAGAAAAADARKIADDIVNLINAGGEATASYDDATESGGTVTISNFKVAGTGGEDNSAEIGQIIIGNAVDRAGGGFTADSLTFGNGKLTGDGNNISWAAAQFSGVTLPTAAELQGTPSFVPFTSFSISGLTIDGEDMDQPMSVDEFEVTVGNITDGVPHEGIVTLTGIEVPMEALGDADQQAIFSAMGYDGFTVNLIASGGYASATDTITLQTFTIDIEEVGKVVLSGVFSGVPLSKLQSEEGIQEVLATAKIDSATFRFENTGIVDKFLEMQATQMGTTREDLVNQFSAAMPMMLNMIGNPAFQDKLATAVATFLQDPQSLTLTAAPGSPVPVMQIIGVSQSAPETLPDVLAVGVTANQ